MEFKSLMEEMVGQTMSRPIALKKFFDEYKSILKADVIPVSDEDVQLAMRLTNRSEDFQAISEKCDLSQLQQPDDAPIIKYIPGQPEYKRVQLVGVPFGEHKLRIFKAIVDSKDVSSRNPFRRSSEIYKLVQHSKDTDKEANTELVENPCEFYNDLLITIRIYRPTRATHIGRTLEKPVFAEEFQCLGSNMLTELRDKISCICNKYHFHDISDSPNSALSEKQTDPAFFFITDTFYNDKRKPENADYSHVVLEWAKDISYFQNVNFKVAKMEETRFIDLTVSLGFPQLYQHHGNCEHRFTFSQIELLTPSNTDIENVFREMYPRLQSFGVYNNRLCNMCGTVHFVYAVCNSDRQLHDPAYLCSKCFHSFHYIDGKKVGQFSAYRLQDFGQDINQAGRQDLEDMNDAADDCINLTAENPERMETGNIVGDNQIHENEEVSASASHEGKTDYQVIYNEKDKQLIVVKEKR